MKQRFAYLIVAHCNFGQLESLIRLLDDERNDLYLHVDQKVDNFDFEYFARVPQHSAIYFVEDRISVEWAHVSLTQCELSLFETASKRGHYDYYHLISGLDLPLRTQDEIHAFFATHAGKEFIAGTSEGWDWRRLEHRHLFQLRKIKKSPFKCVYRTIRHAFLDLQRLVRYNGVKGRLGTLYKGSNWVSLTDACVRYLIDKMKEDIVYYKYSHCGDEIYKQTAIFNSPFGEHLYEPSQGQTVNLRYVDWTRGDPCTLRSADFDELINSECLFARKFDEQVDAEIIQKIICHLANS